MTPDTLKVLEISDLHHKGSRRDAVLTALQDVHNKCDDLRIGLVINAGDTFDQPQVGDSRAPTGTLLTDLGTFQRGLVATHGCPIINIEGQHDSTTSGKSAVAPLAEVHDNIYVVDKPQVLTFDELGLIVCAMPYLYPGRLFGQEELSGMTAEELGRAFRGRVQEILAMFRHEAMAAHEQGWWVIFAGHLRVAGVMLPGGFAIEDNSRELVVTTEQLLEVGADRYVLGDIHVYRNEGGLVKGRPSLGGYVGTIAEDGFGEGAVLSYAEPARNRESVNAGYNITTYTRKDGLRGAIEAERHISPSPQYITLDGEGLRKWRGELPGDRHNPPTIKIRDHVQPTDDELRELNLDPSTITFEMIPSTVERRVRAEDIRQEETLSALFWKWVAVQEDSELMLEESNRFNDTIADYVTNAPPHESKLGSLQSIDRIRCRNIVPHRELDLDFSNVEGVIGFAGGNGTGKTMALEIVPMTLYGKSPSGRDIRELMMDDSADMEVRFTSAGKRYRAHRMLKRKGSTVTQDVYLYELPEPDADGILLAGPKQAEFNAKIEELVGDEDLFLAMAFSAQFATGDITQVPPRLRKEILGTFVGADRFVPIWEMAKADLATTERESDTTAARITILEQEAVKLRELDVLIADLDRKLTEHEVQVQVAEADLETARGKVNEWTKLETERDQTREQINRETAEARTVKERITSIGKDGKEREDLCDQVNGVDRYRHDIEKADALIEQQRVLTDELRGFAGAEHHARQTYTEAKAAEDKQMEYFKRQRDETDTLLKRNEKLASRLNDPDLGCPVEKPTCKFMVDATEADDGLVEIRRTLRHMQKACETRDPKLGAATDKALEQLNTARENLEHHQEIVDALTDLSTLDERKRQAQKMLDSGHKAELRLRELSALLALVPELEADLKARKTRIEELTEKQRDTCTRFNAVAAGQPHDKFEELQGLLRNQQTTGRDLTMEKGRFEQKRETAQKAGEEIETLTAQSKMLKAKEWMFTMIRAAFATNGIPQLLIENAAEQLEIAANETLEALGLDVRIQFETLQETKSGTTREALNILIVDENGARDILTYSGGEQKLLRFVVRAAMLKFQAEREGKKVEVIMMDEMFDALDDVNCDRILKAIDTLADHFRQVFMVAHSVSIVSRLRTRVYFTKDQGISTVEVQR